MLVDKKTLAKPVRKAREERSKESVADAQNARRYRKRDNANTGVAAPDNRLKTDMGREDCNRLSLEDGIF
jgi:hypothetical protein